MGKLDETCQDCGLFREFPAECPNMGPRGAAEPWLHVVGNFPGPNDDREGKPFRGPYGDELEFALKRVGADMRRVSFDNVIRCVPPNKTVPRKQLKACAFRARDEIQRRRPYVVLVLGNEAIEGLWESQKGGQVFFRRGAVVPLDLPDGQLASCVVTFHPETIYNGTARENESVWFEDLALAWTTAKKAAAGDEVDVEFRADIGLLREPKESKILTRFSDLREFFPRLRDAEVCAFDWETTGLKPWTIKNEEHRLPVETAILTAGFAFDEGKYSIPMYPDNWNSKGRAMIYDAIAKWLTESTGRKIAHNLKFELLWALVEICGPVYDQDPRQILRELFKNFRRFDDTMLLAWLDDERTKQSSLKRKGWEVFGAEDWSAEIPLKKMWLADPTKAAEYNTLDAWQTLKLREWAGEYVLNDSTLAHVYNSVTLPAAFSFADVELQGMLVDEEEREALRSEYQGTVDDMRDEIIRIVADDGHVDEKVVESGKPWNPGSTEQLSRYFTETCHYRMLKKTIKGWSTDEATLEHLVAQYDDPVAEILLDLRGLVKMDGTYISGMDQHICTDGRIHASFNIAGPVTGRTSSSDPNMQNFPKRDKKQKQIRRQIVAPPGYKLCSFDYGQIEARLFGVITGDPDFVQALYDDIDIHYENSAELFGEKNAMAHRDPVKNGTFALFYGAGDPRVADTVSAPIEDVAALRSLVFSKYRLIIPWQKEVVRFYETFGYVESLFGRRRRAPMSYNEILNQTNQSTASDMTLTAQNVLWQDNDIGLMIHDDLSFLIRDDDALPDRLVQIADIMLAVPWLLMHDSPFVREWVPMQVECSIGDNWCDLDEVFKVNSLQMNQGNLEQTLDRGYEALAEMGCEDLLIAA